MADRPAEIEAEINLERPYNAADPEAVNEARRRSGRKERERASVVQALMDLREGRAWMRELLSVCHLFENVFQPGQSDSTAFQLGERNIGLRLLADVMRVAPDQYVTMMKEANEP